MKVKSDWDKHTADDAIETSFMVCNEWLDEELASFPTLEQAQAFVRESKVINWSIWESKYDGLACLESKCVLTGENAPTRNLDAFSLGFRDAENFWERVALAYEFLRGRTQFVDQENNIVFVQFEDGSVRVFGQDRLKRNFSKPFKTMKAACKMYSGDTDGTC